MANFERYEPRPDRRVFDGGEIEEQEDEEEGSRLPLLLVIGLLVVAAFCGVVWLAYTQGVQRGRADAPRMLVAASSPAKATPDNAGETPLKNLKIYQQPAPADDEDTESPQPPTAKAVQPQASAPKSTAPRKVVQAAPAPAAPVHRTAAPATVSAPPPAPTVVTHPPRALAPPPAMQAKAEPAPVIIPAPASVDTEAAPPPKVHAGGSVALQIGAYKSEDEANAAWHSFAHKHPIVGAYPQEIRKADLGDKGVWYRLRLAGFADKGAADAFCDKLKADGGTCFLAK